jgi:hypothetical protein
MRTLRLPLLTGLVAGALSALPANSAQSGASSRSGSESGVFFILAGGNKIGAEKYQIASSSGGFEATAELELQMPGGPRTVESCTLQLDSDWQPRSYVRQQNSPRKGSLTVKFEPSQATLVSKTEAGSSDQIFFLSARHLVVLDTNFFHHYEFLLRQYDPSGAGPQSFSVFVPQEALPATISMELKGQESQTIAGAAMSLNHFQASTDEIKMDIWATAEGQIQRIAIPQASVEIIRQ